MDAPWPDDDDYQHVYETHFTNRVKQREEFAKLLDQPVGEPLPVVMYHGVGGVGKSWLIRHLRDTLKPLGIPSAFIDLEPRPGERPYLLDPIHVLVKIREDLDIECPRFDMAYAEMRFQQGAEDEPVFKHGGKLSTAWELAGVAAGAAVGAAVTGGLGIAAAVGVWLASKGGTQAAKKLRRSRLVGWIESKEGRTDVNALKAMSADKIAEGLAKRLGDDLAEVLPKRPGKACEAVIFLETFEAIGRNSRHQSEHREKEQWVRDLRARLKNVLLAIAGRDKLHWHEIRESWGDSRYLRQHLLGGLSRPDAIEFLAKFRIGDGPLREAVLRVSYDATDARRAGEEAYHPYTLGLCGDTIANERDRPGGREPNPTSFAITPNDLTLLTDRFLRSLHNDEMATWITALALTPRFDAEAAKHAHTADPCAARDAAWNGLARFSFFKRTDIPGWSTLHAHMADVLGKKLARTPEAHRGQHAQWQTYWAGRATTDTDDFAALAWSHRYQIDPEGALDQWNRLAEAARRATPRTQMALHHRLLDWWTPIALKRLDTPIAAKALSDLGVELVEASLGIRSENLAEAVACYHAALRVYTEADHPAYWAMTQNNLGIAYRNLSAGDRADNLVAAITCFEAAMRVYTEADHPAHWAATQNNLGNAYLYLPVGDRAANLAAAADCYRAALRVRTEADYPAQWAMTQNNLGAALAELPAGDRIANLAEAVACYRQTLRVYTEADHPAQWAATQNNLGKALAELPAGDRVDNLAAAVTCFEAALRAYAEADYPGQFGRIQFNLGLVLMDQGDWHAADSAFAAALRGFQAVGWDPDAQGATEQLDVVRAMLAEKSRTGSEEPA